MIIAREVSRDPAVLVASQPTRGLDVGAIEYVHRRLVTERDEGRAILLVSLELEEVLSLSDRILVIFEGRIVAEFGAGADRDALGAAMLGGAGPRPREHHRPSARRRRRARRSRPPVRSRPGRVRGLVAPHVGRRPHVASPRRSWPS